MTIFLAQAAVDLSQGWSDAWGAISGTLGGGLTQLMTIVGALLVVGAIGKWLWDKRRGGGGASQAVLWTMAVGAALAAPNLLIPLFLNIVDILINAAVDLFNASTG